MAGRQPHGPLDAKEVWTAVDEYAKPHLIPSDTPFYKELNSAAKFQIESGLPDIAVSALQGKFLALQCTLINAKNVLEIGTLAGYSTIWMASSSPSIKITTIEYEAHHVDVTKQNIANAGLSDRIEVLHGAGLDVLPSIKQDVLVGKREKFDFVFIDADKENNLNYFNEAVEMCNKGACIVVDNVVRRGNVASEEVAKEDGRVRGSREVIEGVGRDKRVSGTVVQTVGEKGYDGFLMAVVK